MRSETSQILISACFLAAAQGHVCRWPCASERLCLLFDVMLS
jgi:hypothetical protein